MAKISSKLDSWCCALLGIDWSSLSLLVDSYAFPTQCANQCLRECDYSEVYMEEGYLDDLLVESVIPHLCIVNSPIELQ